MFNLQELRQAIVESKPISLTGNGQSLPLEAESVVSSEKLVIGDEEIDINSETNFADQDNQTHPLKTIVFSWLTEKLSIVEYKEECSKYGISDFKFLVRTELNTWLTGNSDQCKFVITEAEPTNQIQDTQYDRISQFEVESVDHNAILRGAKNIEFSYLIKDTKLLISQMKKNKPIAKQSRHLKSPIIILSPSTSALITLNNIKIFLEESRYVESQTLPRPSNGVVTVNRKSDKLHSSAHTLTIVDNVEFFTKPEYWDRVVAIFTTGQSWQFNKYKYSNPEMLFQKYWGVYVCYGSDVVPKVIQDWHTHVLRIDRDKRFRDNMIVNEFWGDLERVLIQRGWGQ